MWRLQRIIVAAGMVLMLMATGATAQGAGFQLKQDQVSPGQARLLSVLYPGLGQLAAGHRQRGTAMIVGHTVFLVAWLSSNSDFGTHEDQFDLESAGYSSLREGGSFENAKEAWRRVSDRKDDIDQAHTTRVTCAALTAVLYGYNLVDVFLLGGVEPPQDRRMSLRPRKIGEAPGLALVARWR
jgi:hypothetical protein